MCRAKQQVLGGNFLIKKMKLLLYAFPREQTPSQQGSQGQKAGGGHQRQHSLAPCLVLHRDDALHPHQGAGMPKGHAQMHACETSSKNSLHVQKLITVGFFREAPPISLLGSAFQWMLQGCSPETYKMLPLFFEKLFFIIQQFFSEWKFLTTVIYFPVSTLIYTRVIAVSLLHNKTTGRPSSPLTHHPSAPVPASLFSRQCPTRA